MMPKYEQDEFDSIVPSGRKGAHRRHTGGMSQTAAIALIAVLAVVALVMAYAAIRIINSSTVNPEEQIAGPQPTVTPSTAAPTEVAVDEFSGTVQVLNASGIDGAGEAAVAKIQQAGWKTVTTELGSSASSTSVVYYADGFADEADKLADAVGATQTEQSSKYETDLTLLLNSDIAKGLASATPGSGATDPASEAGGTEGGAGTGSGAGGTGAGGAGSGAGSGAGTGGSRSGGGTSSGGGARSGGSRGGSGDTGTTRNNDSGNKSGGSSENQSDTSGSNNETGGDSGGGSGTNDGSSTGDQPSEVGPGDGGGSAGQSGGSGDGDPGATTP